MYSVKQFNKVVSSFKPILDKHFYASTKQSSESILHFSYRLLDLQKEIEKRTFYLGKYRKTEEAAHLMDLIGMSRDEGDLLYPFAQEAMANVYDQLNLSTQHITKKYEWKERSAPIELTLIPDVNRVINDESSALVCNISNDKKSITVSGGAILAAKYYQYLPYANDYYVNFRVGVSYKTKTKVLNADVLLNFSKEYTFDIPKENVLITSVTPTESTTDDPHLVEIKCMILPTTIQLPLDPQSTITSSETIQEVENTMLLKNVDGRTLILKNPKELPVGCIVTADNVIYEIVNDTNENDLVLANDAVQVDENEAMAEGIHYYLSVPNYLNLTTVAPLDNAIKEALVNRIIWKWLVLSYPTEAATYDTLYQDNLKSIAMRCNIFNKHWQQVPRIL